MKERLVELCDNIITSCKSSLCADCEYNNIDYPNCMSVHFADKILADGWMRPPCKVGGVVYSIVDCINHPEKLFVTAIHQYKNYISFSALSRSQRKYVFEEADIGKTVFLTREDAVKALEGKEDEGK